MPRVSVVVPVFNAESHISEFLDSIVGQTLEDIEVLCVDDGSTDGSPAILDDYARRDSRVRVLRQRNAGAGAARNAGLAAAQGDYVAFLDADDFFEPTMLEHMHRKCVEDQADIAVCRVRYFDVSSGRSFPANRLLRMGQLPPVMPFSFKDVPDHILTFTANATWNKIFKRSFVLDEGLRFQEITRTNDLFFTNMALARAARVTVVDKALAYYRVGHEESLQARNDEAPLEFYQALDALRNGLHESGVFEELERSFVNLALSTCLYNLHSLRTLESFHELYGSLKREYLVALGITGQDADYFFSEREHEQYTRIITSSPEAYLFDELRYSRGQLRTVRWELKESAAKLKSTEGRIRRITQSRSYRFARRIAGWLQ